MRVSNAGGELWRRDNPFGGASKFVVELAPHIVTGGYSLDPQGRAAPTIEAFDRVSGKRMKSWTGSAADGLDTLVSDGFKAASGQAIFLAVDIEPQGDAKADGPPKLHVFEFDQGIRPRLLFSFEPY